MSGGEVIGMVTLSDLFEAAGIPLGIAATSGPWHRYEHSLAQSEKKVQDVMSHQVVSVPPAAPIAEAASLMRTYRINRLPVVDRTGTLHGIVARDDIIDAVALAAHELHSIRPRPGMSALTSDGGEATMSVRASFTSEEARMIGFALGLDWDHCAFDVAQFREGLDVELEHGRRGPTTDVTNDDPVVTGKIALAHLRELPDYYTRLSRMEHEEATP
jgi:CBS-domain-containing membrane protein